jgi:hypothetical protein
VRRWSLTLLLALLSCACQPAPEPQILWPESVLHPKPYQAPPPRSSPPAEPAERPYMCHPYIVAELRFEPGEAEPLDREHALTQLRERVSDWGAYEEYERPNLFFALGYYGDDEGPSLAKRREEAMRALAIEACIDPAEIVEAADIMDPPHATEDRHRVVLLANSPVSCLL